MKFLFPSCLALMICLISACQPTSQTETKDAASRQLPTAQSSDRLNILWIVTEDLSPYLPAFGDSTIETPNLSRLAAEGVRYTRAFSPSGVCAPSRAALATGMYPSSIGANHMRTGNLHDEMLELIIPYEAVPPAGIKMHSERLREAGYYCTNNRKEDYQFKKPLTAWDESSDEAHWRNRAPGQPFFSIFNFTITHESRIWAKSEDSLWVAEDLPVNVPPYLPDNEVGQRDMRRMYSNLKEMDVMVGEVLAQLEEDGELENTVIFFYGDHGGPLPRQKRLCYDSGLQIPLIIRFPNQERAGEIDEQLVSFIDFKPTIMSLVGIQPEPGMQGRAFLGEYQVSAPRKYIHGAGDRFDAKYDMIRAVRDDRFKYLRNYQPEKPYYLPVKYREQMPVMQELLRLRDAGELTPEQALWFRDTKDKEELFDTEADPHELNNLAADPQYAEKLAELRAECDRWMAEIQDVGELPEPELIEKLWPGSQRPACAEVKMTRTEEGIQLSCETEGASIGYQWVNAGEESGESWQVYTEALAPEAGKQLMVVADRIGYAPSEIQQIP
ncbi:MAG: sulfatase [Bacteroidota bacterium]